MTPSDHLSRLSPADAVATLRSLPRRFRGELTVVGADDPLLARAEVVDQSGWSAAAHVRHAARDLEMLDNALNQTLTTDEPVLHPATMTDAEREWVPDNRSVTDYLSELSDACSALADRAEHVDADDWARPARVGNQTVKALDLLRHAVGAALSHLDGVKKALASAS